MPRRTLYTGAYPAAAACLTACGGQRGSRPPKQDTHGRRVCPWPGMSWQVPCLGINISAGSPGTGTLPAGHGCSHPAGPGSLTPGGASRVGVCTCLSFGDRRWVLVKEEPALSVFSACKYPAWFSRRASRADSGLINPQDLTWVPQRHLGSSALCLPLLSQLNNLFLPLPGLSLSYCLNNGNLALKSTWLSAPRKE